VEGWGGKGRAICKRAPIGEGDSRAGKGSAGRTSNGGGVEMGDERHFF